MTSEINIKDLVNMSARKMTQPCGLDYLGDRSDEDKSAASIDMLASGSEGSDSETQFDEPLITGVVLTDTPREKLNQESSESSSDDKENEAPTETQQQRHRALAKAAFRAGMSNKWPKDTQDLPFGEDDDVEAEATFQAPTVSQFMSAQTVTEIVNAKKPAAKKPTTTTKKKEPLKRWPNFDTVVTKCQPAVQLIFQAITDFDCCTELTASNKNNPKGNKWSKLFNHLHVGDMTDGTRGPLLRAYPALMVPQSSASTMKEKMLKLVQFCATANDGMESLISEALCDKACELRAVYNATKETADEEAAEANNKRENLQKEMEECEVSQGLLPPGAKGKKDSGRAQHSTNLKGGEPALCLYARGPTPQKATTTTDSSSISSKATSSSKKTKSSCSSAAVNAHALDDIRVMSQTMETLCSTLVPPSNKKRVPASPVNESSHMAAKRRKHESKASKLEHRMRFLKEMGLDITAQANDYNRIQDKLMNLEGPDSSDEEKQA